MAEIGEMTSWELEIYLERDRWGDQSEIVKCTLTEDELKRKFDPNFEAVAAPAFLMWTHERVYFSHEYSDCQSVESVPREPCDEVPRHL